MLTFFRRCSHQNASVPYLTNHLDTSDTCHSRIHQGCELSTLDPPSPSHQACVQVPSYWQITCCGFWRKASWKFLASVEKGKLRRSKSIEILLKHKIILAHEENSQQVIQELTLFMTFVSKPCLHRHVTRKNNTLRIGSLDVFFCHAAVHLAPGSVSPTCIFNICQSQGNKSPEMPVSPRSCTTHNNTWQSLRQILDL